jgi:hypothetical protein
VGKYGTNLEGFGAFEGGVNADKGAPLVSTSSDGETALLFGPAALREIQAGVANGDFAIPPDAAGDTITAENPLPYWTFTDVNSAGAITAAIVADAGAGSGNVLRFTVASGTLTGKSATLTRYVPVASSASRSFSFYAEATFDNATSTTQANATLSCQFYKADQTTTTGTGFTSSTVLFSAMTTPNGLTAPTIFTALPNLQESTAPADAAYLKLTITIATVATQSANRTIDLTEVRVANGLPEVIFTDRAFASPPAYIAYDAGTLRISEGTNNSQIDLLPDGGASTIGIFANTANGINLTSGQLIQLDAPETRAYGDLVIDGANSNLLARVTATATQSLTNNTATKITFNTASSTPTTDSYDPQAWFDNANDRITIGQAGFYTISANVGFATNATGRRLVQIYVNGSDRGGVQVAALSGATTILSASTNVYLAVNDYVEVFALQQSGGALNTVFLTGVYPSLSVGRIGA